MSGPAVAVIVPTFNSGTYLEQTVASVVAQDFVAWELLLSDDGSTDGTPQASERTAAREPRIRLLSGSHGGANQARNRAAKEAGPGVEFFLFLDHDDVLEPGALRLLVTVLRSTPSAVAAYGPCLFIDVHGTAAERDPIFPVRQVPKRGRLVPIHAPDPTPFEAFAYGQQIYTGGQVLVRRTAFESLGGWRANMGSAADYDLWLRLSLLGEIAFVDQPVIGYRAHGSNWSKRTRAMERDDIKVRMAAFRDASLGSEQRAALEVGYRMVQLTIARSRLRWAFQSLRRGAAIEAAKQIRRALIVTRNALLGLPRMAAVRRV